MYYLGSMLEIFENPLADRILIGILGEEKAGRPGVYAFSSTDGQTLPDVHILSQDASLDGAGEDTRPRSGSPCVVAISHDGGQGFVIGFIRIPTFDEEGDEDPFVGNPDENKVAGDKVFKTSGGASFILKRGGAVIVEGGSGVGVILNPLNRQMSLRSSNYRIVADGYKAVRGRRDPGSTASETFHVEEFTSNVGADFDRFTVEHSGPTKTHRRQLSLASVKDISSQETATIKTRETYYSDGSWVGEGPKYQWGGKSASEPAVLGNALVTAMNRLMDIIKELKVNTAWGPSTPPLPPTLIAIDQLKSELSGNILSNFLLLSKDPAEIE